MAKTFHFVAGVSIEGGNALPVAICLEHYLVTQADTLDGIRTACADLLLAHDEANREEGLDPWDLAPPPADAIAEIRALPGSIEFELSYEPRPTP